MAMFLKQLSTPNESHPLLNVSRAAAVRQTANNRQRGEATVKESARSATTTSSAHTADNCRPVHQEIENEKKLLIRQA
jgi:hypothetical protein